MVTRYCLFSLATRDFRFVPGTQLVLDALESFSYLERQSVPQERRCSFLVHEAMIDDALKNTVASLGCELLFSARKYLDVLPKGTGKGSTLRKLCAHLDLAHEMVVTAGDTLNDLSMFQEGFSSIVVGGAEPALVHAVRDDKRVYLSSGEGCAGIIEGLAHYQFLKSEKPSIVHQEGTSDLVMVYHRLPFDELVNGERRRPKSPNGIIPPLLNFFTSGVEGSWVAWSQQASRSPNDFEVHVDVDVEKYPKLKAARIPFLAQDVELF